MDFITTNDPYLYMVFVTQIGLVALMIASLQRAIAFFWVHA